MPGVPVWGSSESLASSRLTPRSCLLIMAAQARPKSSCGPKKAFGAEILPRHYSLATVTPPPGVSVLKNILPKGSVSRSWLYRRCCMAVTPSRTAGGS